MKTEEAKKKWCPFARTFKWKETTAYGSGIAIGAAAVNRQGSKYNRCLAEGCMMWVFTDKEEGYCGLIRSEVVFPGRRF